MRPSWSRPRMQPAQTWGFTRGSARRMAGFDLADARRNIHRHKTGGLCVQTTGMPLVSIIIASYNRADVLRESIDSALTQSYPNVEVIVIDDGSVDETPEVLREYGDRIVSRRQQ